MTTRPSSFPVPKYRTGDDELDTALVDVLEQIDTDHPDLVFEMLTSVVRLGGNGTGRGDLKLLNSALKELRHAIEVFAPYADRRKVSIFGSARTVESAREYRQAHDFAEAMVAEDWMVITGAGPGIMTAGVIGAGAQNAFGVNIVLPFESGTPPGLENDSKLVNFRYFFSRKLMFMKESHGYALFPGGFGTMDETFELLTLMQTGRTYLAPVVMLDADTSYWETWTDFVQRELGHRHLISPPDLDLVRICHTVEEAVDEVCAFYDNYHSMRFVGKRLVVRLTRELPTTEISAIEHEFADIIASGGIDKIGATDSEIADDDVIDLPRLAFVFDRRSYGRLRQLIDRINHHQPPSP